MTEATTDDPIRLAATLEADTLQRAGQITYTQARARIRDRQASPVAHLALQQTEALNRALAALRELHSTCVLLDHPDENQQHDLCIDMNRDQRRELEARYIAQTQAMAREAGLLKEAA